MERISIVGIGSPHGDDQAGWLVVDLLENSSCRDVRLYRAKVPHDMLDFIDDCDELHLIDCCQSTLNPTVSIRLDLVADSEFTQTGQLLLVPKTNAGEVREADTQVTYLRSQGTHQLDLTTVLQLAQTLNRLPKDVTLWVVPGCRFEPTSAVSETCCLAIADCSRRIIDHIRKLNL